MRIPLFSMFRRTRRRIVRPGAHTPGVASRSWHPAPDGTARLATHPPVDPAPSAEFRLTRVDDPDGQCTILAVRGLLGASALAALWGEIAHLGTSRLVHIDMTSASILAGTAIGELEALADTLERHGVDVQIVGISPNHPDLRRSRPTG